MGVAPTVALKRRAKTGAGHAGSLGEGLEGPGVAGVVVHGGDGGAHLLVGEGEEPADTAFGCVGEVEAKGLDEHHVGELLGDEGAAGLGVAELLFHALEGPAHGGLVGLFADVDDGRESVQKDVGVGAGEEEVAAGDGVLGGVVEGSGVGLVGFEKDAEVDGPEGEVGGEGEGEAAGEEEAVAGVEAHGVGDGVDREPALAGEDGIALDALMLGKLDGEVGVQTEAAGDVALGFEQGQDFGEGIHGASGLLDDGSRTIGPIMRTLSIDRIEFRLI